MFSLNDVYNNTSAQNPNEKQPSRSKTIQQPRGKAGKEMERKKTMPYNERRNSKYGSKEKDEVVGFSATMTGSHQAAKSKKEITDCDRPSNHQESKLGSLFSGDARIDSEGG